MLIPRIKQLQHRALNQFLNAALQQSQIRVPASSTSKQRIPMDYKHTRETDTFYELTQAGALALPQSLASGVNINPRHANKSKVRITTDQKTGKVLAKIIKARVADIDIYSPNTLFDWRISVNVEMDYKGELTDLVEPQTRDGKQADRNKDRMSYKHLAYQIDLTQVTPAEVIKTLSWVAAADRNDGRQRPKQTRSMNSRLKSLPKKSAGRVSF